MKYHCMREDLVGHRTPVLPVPEGKDGSHGYGCRAIIRQLVG